MDSAREPAALRPHAGPFYGTELNLPLTEAEENVTDAI
ncbi:hypothetical protein B0H03_11936 [Rathayibacter iranicus NCPPB 2253 = VKM Ac-1602]|uniref:Uncharacterized protein n=1 Tax=Rathayibacter iranicus NCPPB 2253 = VKM Ac-1602 TaxID=1328868 RepID=A0ABX5LAA7_9MICO|nr:hypothetical protein B0H03_11936 [Rathayibacter iranicus NCPPB 2253 = VKM Ac-1602]